MLHYFLLSMLLVAGCASNDDSDSVDTDDYVDDRQNPDGEGPARVDLGNDTDPASPASFALLAKTGVTNVIGTSITGGNVGVSPASASFITGFALVADASNAFSTSASVVPPGQVLAADYASPTPSLLTTAIAEMEAAYTDAAGRANPDELNLSDGNLGGLTLIPGLYTWGSAVTVPTDLTLAGGPDDVWIFQITNALDVAAATSIILTGGAAPANIFWQVADEVTVHENAHFEGVILGKTGITLQTNASLDGRALSQTLIALDDNLVTSP